MLVDVFGRQFVVDEWWSIIVDKLWLMLVDRTLPQPRENNKYSSTFCDDWSMRLNRRSRSVLVNDFRLILVDGFVVDVGQPLLEIIQMCFRDCKP